eukprot:gene19699-biopygen20545
MTYKRPRGCVTIQGEQEIPVPRPRHARATPAPPKPKIAYSPRHARAMPAPRPRHCPVPPGVTIREKVGSCCVLHLGSWASAACFTYLLRLGFCGLCV